MDQIILTRAAIIDFPGAKYLHVTMVWTQIKINRAFFVVDFFDVFFFGGWGGSSPRFLCRLTAFCSTCWSRGTSESSTCGKQRICRCNSASTHFHVSWLSDFIFYPKPLYKSLRQSFFYSFITILPSENGVTLDYSTIFPLTLWFRHFTSILEHLSRDFEKTTITAMYHGRWFAYKQTNKYLYCQS